MMATSTVPTMYQLVLSLSSPPPVDVAVGIGLAAATPIDCAPLTPVAEEPAVPAAGPFVADPELGAVLPALTVVEVTTGRSICANAEIGTNGR
jgi:hypothetical protein